MEKVIKEILRAQYDGRGQRWRIVKKTSKGSGGWARFGSPMGYSTQEETERMINRIIEYNPDMYQREENLEPQKTQKGTKEK